MPFRVTFYFQFAGDRLAGWSENFWNLNTDASSVATAAQKLGVQLTQTKANGVQWTRTRFSIPGSPRNSFTIINQPAYGVSIGTGTAPTSADYQVTKWLLQLTHLPFPATSPGQNSTRQWFGGVMDGSIQNAGYVANNPASASLGTLQGLLKTPGEGWRMWQLDPSFPGSVITSINNTTGIVTLPAAPSFGTAVLVRVSRVRNLTYANGLWTWQPVSGQPNQVQLMGWQPQLNVMTTSPKALIRPQLYAPQTIVSAVVVRASNHRVGRPTGQFGGRRTKTIKH